MAFELGTIPRWGFADMLGIWNANGKVHFKRAAAHDQDKTVYKDRDGLIPHDNPIDLDAIGSVGAIYFEDDEAYYITLNDSDDTTPPIWDFDNYWATLSAADASTGSSSDSEHNFVLNGQFRFQYHTSFSSLAASELAIAPYWYFDKSNTTATDTITFVPFLVGVDDPPFSPTYYCRYNCSNTPTGESSKEFYIKIQDVNAFQDQQITISIEQTGTVPSQTFEFRYVQNFGTGGSPSASVEGAIAANNITANWTKISETTTLPSISGKTLGSNKDDYLAILIRLPLDAATQFDFINFQINLGTVTFPYEYQTYDIAKIDDRTANFPIYRDLNGLVTEQNATDTTKLITIGQGVCTDSTGHDLYKLRSAITKDVTATWAEGDSVGGLADGLTIAADTWYNKFLLFSSTGKIDAGSDTSLTATNLLADPAVIAAGYILYRRVASFRTFTGSALIKDYHQTHDTFLFDDPDNFFDYTMAAPETTHLFILDVPPGFRVEAIMNLLEDTGWVYAAPPYVSSIAPSTTASPLYTYDAPGSSEGGRKLYIITDDSQQIRQTHISAVGNRHFLGVTLGWKDWRRD